MQVESVNSEAALVQEQVCAERFLEMTTDLFSVLFMIYDTQSKKLSYNFEQLSAALGYNAETLRHAETFNLLNILSKEDLPAFTAALESREERPTDFTCRMMNVGGDFIPFVFKLRRTINNEGHTILVMRAISTTSPFMDTERKMLNEAINDLKQTNRELEDFAYVASHDLQEPLRKITTFSTRLTEKYKDNLQGEGAMYLDRIVASANNMRMFIDSLLDFSRVSTVKQSSQETNLTFVVGQVKADLELVIEETGCTITVDKLPKVMGSVTQLKQLFTNLVSNAIKFRKPGIPPHINITTASVTDEEIRQYQLPAHTMYHRVVVSDNGIGFDAQYAERIFEVFQRLHGKSEYPGSGVGLAICKKIMDQHGGIIYAQGASGRGASFTLIFPECSI